MFCLQNKPKSTGQVREKGKKAPKKRYVFIRKIEKVGKYDKYKDLVDNQKVSTWFSVEDIADL